MNLNSTFFLFFLLIVYSAFYLFSPKHKWLILLISSFLFCISHSLRAYLILLIISLLDFAGGALIFRYRTHEKIQKYLLFTFIFLNILLLAVLKYLGFIFENINIFLSGIKTGQINVIHIVAPVGISYYILQGIGYIVDIYWGKIEKEKHFGYFLLYISFFPKFVMGPIERAGDLLPQIKKLHRVTFDYYHTKVGCLLILWGFFQKSVVADRLAIWVNNVYVNPSEKNGLLLIVATILFTFQIYYDFAGYTNMALGVGRLFNIRLTQNFIHPYFAVNIQEFWRRWHISFSFWIRDYIFTPLRIKYRLLRKTGLVLSLFTTFVLVGLWHEAKWTWVAFGIIHGIYMSGSTLTLKSRDTYWGKKGLHKQKWLLFMRRFATFSMICFSMIFVRANSIVDALHIVKNIILTIITPLNVFPILNTLDLKYAFFFIFLGEMVHLMERCGKIQFFLFETPGWARWPVYYAMAMIIFVYGIFSEEAFIYAQF